MVRCYGEIVPTLCDQHNQQASSETAMSDYIPWRVMNCEREDCPLLCRSCDEIDNLTGEKAMVKSKTVCPKCLGSVEWKLKELYDLRGVHVHSYCHGHCSL